MRVYIAGKKNIELEKSILSYGSFEIIYIKDIDDLLNQVKSYKDQLLYFSSSQTLLDFDLSSVLRNKSCEYNYILCSLVTKEHGPDFLSDKLMTPSVYRESLNGDLYPEGYKDIGVYLINNMSLLRQSIESFMLKKLETFDDFKILPVYNFSKNLMSNDRKPVLFLDRDGIINEDTGYLYKIEELKYVNGIFELIKTANKFDLSVVVVTNQSGVGRGYYQEDDVIALHEHMDKEMVNNGAQIDMWKYCIYHPEAKNEKLKGISFHRKPFPGMFLDIGNEIPVNFNKSIMVGDKKSDYILGDLIGKTFHLKGNYVLDGAKGQIIKSLKEIETFIKNNY